MKMTVDQVKADILSGKTKRIYYSAHTLWWTHLDDDVNQASELGKQRQLQNHEIFMSRQDIPQEKKEEIARLYKMAKSVTIPLDPSGSPLMQFDTEKDINEWVSIAEEKPEFFGKHGIDAFMYAHHQNNEFVFAKWDDINNQLDLENVKS